MVNQPEGAMARLTAKFLIRVSRLERWVAEKRKSRRPVPLVGEPSVLSALETYLATGEVPLERAYPMLQIVSHRISNFHNTPFKLEVRITGGGDDYGALCRHLERLMGKSIHGVKLSVSSDLP